MWAVTEFSQSRLSATASSALSKVALGAFRLGIATMPPTSWMKARNFMACACSSAAWAEKNLVSSGSPSASNQLDTWRYCRWASSSRPIWALRASTTAVSMGIRHLLTGCASLATALDGRGVAPPRGGR